MANWDIFKVRDFEQTFDVDESEVRRLLANGELAADDCVRRAGQDKWIRVGTLPEFVPPTDAKPAEPPKKRRSDAPVHRMTLQRKPDETPPGRSEEPTPPPVRSEKSAPPKRPDQKPADAEQPNEVDDAWEEFTPVPSRAMPPAPTDDAAAAEIEPDEADLQDDSDPSAASSLVINTDDDEDDDDLFTHELSRSRRRIEELDLTAMVDVTFLLVLFFMITATYTLQKSINVPAPDPEEQQAQQAIQNLDDLRDDYITVTVNADNTLDVDGEPVRADLNSLVERIRRINRESAKNELIIYADGAAHHETVVLVYDAANEVGMQRVSLAVAVDGEL